MKNIRNVTVITAIFSFLALVLYGNAPALADQDHMDKALSALKDAKGQLEKANPNKGGHRAKAIRYIDNAIEEIHKGNRYAEGHGSQSNHQGSRNRQVNLNDLNGMKASHLDSTMHSRGFTNKGGYKQHGRSYTTWWNASTNQCVSVATHQGRIEKTESIFKGNCQ